MPNTNTTDLEIIIHSKILREISRQLRRPSLDTNIIDVLDKYMKIWENCDNYLANGVIDQNLNFAEASIVIQECARVYSKKVKLLWNMVNDFHEVLCNLTGDSKPTNVQICDKPKQSTKKQPETNTTAPQPVTNNAVESGHQVLDKRKEGNNSNENIATETNVEEEEDDEDDDDDVYDEDDCFIVEDENEVPQLKFLKYNTHLDDMSTESVTRKTLTNVWTPIPLCKRRYDPIVYTPNVVDPNDEFLNFTYNTNVPINEHPLYDAKEKLIDINRPLFFLYTVPVFYKMRETDDFVIFKTEEDETVSLIENLKVKKGLENMIFCDVKVKLTPLTNEEILKYTKKECVITSDESNHDFDDHFDDTHEGSLSHKNCEANIKKKQIKDKSSKKAQEIRKRRLGIEERNFEPKPAKLFKPFSVLFDKFENFYHDNYSLEAGEGMKDVQSSNEENQNQNNTTPNTAKSIDSGRYSMGLPADDDNHNCSGYDSGIGMTPHSVARNNETYLENMFPDISFDPETIDMYKNLVGDDTEEKRMKEKYDEWEARINEITADAEKKSDFDIHVYEDKILNSFSDDDNKVQFSSIIADRSASEMSRFVVATLQLANTYNVEIINHKPGEISNNNMELKFLSNARYHETLNEYHAPSEEMFNEKFAAIKRNCNFMQSTPTTSKHAATSSKNSLSKQNIKRRKLSLN